MKNSFLALIVCFLYCQESTEKSYGNHRHTFILGEDPNFLKKYSYEICMKKGNKVVSLATCFFYKTGSQTWLLTNVHVLTGWKMLENCQKAVPDEAEVFLTPIGAGKPRGIKISINPASLKQGHPSIFEDIDFDGFMLSGLHHPENLNYINDLIDTSYLQKIPNQVILFGFGGGQQIGLVRGKYITNFARLDSLVLRNNKPTERNNILKNNGKLREKYFFIDKVSEHGISGSPVFGKYFIQEGGHKKCIYKFIGVAFGINESLRYTWVIRGTEIVRKLPH